MTDELRVDAPDFHPRVFMSYSSEPVHNDWVRRLSERLMSNGIDIVLDQWDVGLGSDLSHFMEQGVTGSDRVIAVCSDSYIEKANAGKRGVGYEKKIMTADLLKDAMSDHIVPVIRCAGAEPYVPIFLFGTRYVDFRDDARWDGAYQAAKSQRRRLCGSTRPVSCPTRSQVKSCSRTRTTAAVS